MKRWLLVALLGLLCGFVAAAAAIYYNPLLGEQVADVSGKERFNAVSAGGDVLSFIHSDLLGWPQTPAAGDPLWENSLANTGAATITWKGSDGRVAAVESRFASPSEATDLLHSGVLLDAVSVLTVPGRGSVFLVGTENIWPLLRRVILPAQFHDEPWQGRASFMPLLGPEHGSTGEAVGATGDWSAWRGRYTELFDVERYSAHPPGVQYQLRLRLLDSADSAT